MSIILFLELSILKQTFGVAFPSNNLISFSKLFLILVFLSKFVSLLNSFKLLLFILMNLSLLNKGVLVVFFNWSSICLACSSFKVLLLNNLAYYTISKIIKNNINYIF